MSTLLLVLSALAYAEQIDDSLLGLAVGTTLQGDVDAGLALGTIDGNLDMYVLFDSDKSEEQLIQSWRFEFGRWGPDDDTEDSTLSAPSDWPAEFALPLAPVKRFISTPWLRVSGDAGLQERFRMNMAMRSLLDIPAFWGVSPSTFYLGPAAGLGMDVRYTTDATRADGALMLDGGAQAGVFIARSVFARIEGMFHLDPFLPARSRMSGGAIVGTSLRQVEVPLGIQVIGETERTLNGPWYWALRGQISLVF